MSKNNALYENIILEQPDYEQQLEYWNRILFTNLTPNMVKNYKLSYKENSGLKPTVSAKITFEIFQKIKYLTSNKNMAIYTLLVTSYKILISKYIDNNDISIISPTIGDVKLNKFVLIRNVIDYSMTFKEALLTFNETIIMAYENQDYPLENILEKNGYSGTISDIVNILIVMDPIHNYFDNDFDIELFIKSEEDLIMLTLSSNSKKFSEIFLKDLLNRFFLVIEQCLNNINSVVSDIKVIYPEEISKLTENFNQTLHPSGDLSIKKSFELIANIYPNNRALVCQDVYISYKDLNIRSNQLARFLVDKGIRTDDIVGIQLGNTIELIISILAIIKSGAIFLPIDESIPLERLTFISKDSSMRMLISNKDIKLEYVNTVTINSLVNLYKVIDLMESDNLEINSADESILYLIYTSGTTGTPKGVQIKNKSLKNYIQWVTDFLNITFEDRMLLISSYAFDLGYTTIFSSIFNGAELHLMDKYDYLDTDILLNYITSNQISFIKTTPSFFNAIANSRQFIEQNMFSTVKSLLLGGESINIRDIEISYDIYKNLQIVNHYGPTETTIGAIAHKIDRESFEIFKVTQTIGKPIYNTKAYILDSKLSLLPIGVPGDLYISGENLSSGYLNNEQLTKEKFISNKYENGNLMYKTGDKAALLEDGCIKFLGRADDQIKIRGYRVELGEVANQIKKLSSVSDCIVTLYTNGTNNYMCAYIIIDVLLIADIRYKLSKFLPEYMIPTYFFKLDSFPMTLNGKADFEALPKPNGVNDVSAK